MGGDDEAERLIGVVRGEEFVDGGGVEVGPEDVAFAGREEVGVGEVFERKLVARAEMGFASDDDAVAEFFEDGGEGFDAFLDEGVVGVRAVFDGHLGGEHRATGGRAGGGGGEGVAKGEAFAREAIDVWSANVFGAVRAAVARGKIVGDEEDDVRGSREGARGDKREDAKKC